jgi:hypothetical protein
MRDSELAALDRRIELEKAVKQKIINRKLARLGISEWRGSAAAPAGRRQRVELLRLVTKDRRALVALCRAEIIGPGAVAFLPPINPR